MTSKPWRSYSGPDASETELRRAARTAGADTFIRSLPQGYQTRLGRGRLLLEGNIGLELFEIGTGTVVRRLLIAEISSEVRED